jgi:hypothetical protein
MRKKITAETINITGTREKRRLRIYETTGIKGPRAIPPEFFFTPSTYREWRDYTRFRPLNAVHAHPDPVILT